MIDYKSEIQDKDLTKVCELYKMAGWWDEQCSQEQVSKLMSESFYFLSAWEEDNIVGMGRVISDSFSDAYIQDVFVDEHYRNKGIAGKLVGRLVDYCYENNIQWIALIATPGSAGLYEKLGFEKMIDHTPMLLRKKPVSLKD
jgi:aralkylamine N-acetyltransferase